MFAGGILLPFDVWFAHSTSPVSADCEAWKVKVMREVVFAKFAQHSELRERLLATGNAHLEEGIGMATRSGERLTASAKTCGVRFSWGYGNLSNKTLPKESQ
ncbi:MAG TPA: hypothetical protein DEB39_11735 [Planctomycetaceae bacterium]|nr:hypothetical protein [Planctomycetaceae bacterium]